MPYWRLFLSFVCPPLAVLDKGCGAGILVFILTIAGWFPGVIAALAYNAADGTLFGQQRRVRGRGRYVEVPVYVEDLPDGDMVEKPKRKHEFIHLEDGATAEVVEDDGAPLEKGKNDFL